MSYRLIFNFNAATTRDAERARDLAQAAVEEHAKGVVISVMATYDDDVVTSTPIDRTIAALD